ncbi:hypothetical protein AAG570_001301 [Ranatra chinensis]|uniref:Secreted protein n=1 Tax=Ranatra chinensis TaxID=642074 RepID=A0ABD0YN57_9HEMI
MVQTVVLHIILAPVSNASQITDSQIVQGRLVERSHPLVTLPDGEYRKKGHEEISRPRSFKVRPPVILEVLRVESRRLHGVSHIHTTIAGSPSGRTVWEFTNVAYPVGTTGAGVRGPNKHQNTRVRGWVRTVESSGKTVEAAAVMRLTGERLVSWAAGSGLGFPHKPGGTALRIHNSDHLRPPARLYGPHLFTKFIEKLHAYVTLTRTPNIINDLEMWSTEDLNQKINSGAKHRKGKIT